MRASLAHQFESLRDDEFREFPQLRINIDRKEIVRQVAPIDCKQWVEDKEPKSPEPSPKDLLVSAKTLCMVSSGNAILKTELSAKLLEWGKLKLVSSPDEADLVLKVVQTSELNVGTGAGNQQLLFLLTVRQVPNYGRELRVEVGP